jgi:hypothetical protein
MAMVFAGDPTFPLAMMNYSNKLCTLNHPYISILDKESEPHIDQLL